METMLDLLPIGQEGVILHMNCGKNSLKRLCDMGIIIGSRVKVVRVAPLGDPIEIEIDGRHYTIRKKEAKKITVQTGE